MNHQEYTRKVYAGVLGKMIGVFHGRPVEGWPYEKIKDTFGIVDRYIYKEAKTPLIVADDDIAGTFTFLNAAEDCKEIKDLKAKDFGEMWLDYIIENKTIFWWGGLGRSTEHTAYLRLKDGMKAPESGMALTNGTAVSEQIGAQIFIDALAMMCPNDPQMARHLVKQSASVSHDKIAVESACFLAGMEAMAFGEKRIDRLIEESIKLGMSERFLKIVDSVSEKCSKTKDFREVRDWLDVQYGYHLYPGNCHVIPNIALILSCLFLGEDDFSKAMNLSVSAGWDTDCNAANLGCLNGIRLGLDSINEKFDYRSPLTDRFYNISADGGNCVSNAEKETFRIAVLKNKLYGEEEQKPEKRFLFSLPGSVQGFCGCPCLGNENCAAQNANSYGLGNGILLEAEHGSSAVSTPVMWDKNDRQANYCLTGSPLLYEGQTVTAEVEGIEGEGAVRLYIASYDFDDNIVVSYGEEKILNKMQGLMRLVWKIPEEGGRTIARIGCELIAEKDHTKAVLRSLDWKGAPDKFELRGSLRNYDMTGFNMMMEAFVSSAKQYSFDSRVTFTVSHTENNGVVTTGTSDWGNYSVTSTLIPSIHERFGIVGRCRGHRRYYGVVFWENKKAAIIKKKGSVETLLAVMDFAYRNEDRICAELIMNGDYLEARINGKKCMEARDWDYACGGAGYVIDCGTVLADGFLVKTV